MDNAENKSWAATLLTLMLVTAVAGCGGAAATSPIGAACAGLGCVNLGTAANYVILAQSGVANVPNSAVNGNVGVSPATRTSLTGWSLMADPTDTYFTSSQVFVPGKLYAADNAGGTTSADLARAVTDMQAAYNSAAGMTGGVCPGAGSLGGLTLAAGHYTCAVNVSINSNLTLRGTPTDIWVFQITGTLTQASATQVILTGGALPQNVFWQVSGNVDIGTTARMQGVILGKTQINMQAGASEKGRLLSQSGVTMSQDTLAVP